jgi:lysophospholipase L1-like esterase
MRPEGWGRGRGAKFGNEGGTTIRWAHDNVATWLKEMNPEVAIILFGTNDLGALPEKEYAEKTAEVVDRCLKNGTVVILTTPPPRSGMLEKSKQFAEAVRRVAKDKKVPLIDYHAEILKRRPDDWDGSLPKFAPSPLPLSPGGRGRGEGAAGEYDVPTLIARDGIHPSFPKSHPDYSEESLRSNGYALRSYLTLLAYADVIRQVLQAEAKQRPAHRPVPSPHHPGGSRAR